MIRPRLLLRLAPVLAALLTNPASAANRWWDGGSADIAGDGDGVSAGGTGTWNTTFQNWDPGNGQPMVAWNNLNNDTAVFAGTAGTVTMDTAITVGGLTLGSALTLANGGNNLTLTGTGTTISGNAAATLSGTGSLIVSSSQTWSNTSGTMTIASPVNTGANLLTLNTGDNKLDVTGKISGTGGLTVNSTATTPTSPDNNGSPTLNNTNDYSGTTTVSGFIWLNSGGLAALGSDNSAIQLHAGGFRLSGTGTVTRGLDLTGNCGISKTGGTTTLNGVISGTGNLQVAANFGTGAPVVLANANTFTGNCLSGPDGTVRLAHADALASANLRWADNNGRSVYDLATHNLACNIGGLGNPAVNNSSNNLNLGTGLGSGGNGLVSFGANHQSNTYIGILSGDAGFRKVGTGVQTLIGENSYTGSTVVAEGTLKLGKIAGQTVPNATTGSLTDKKLNVPSTSNLYIGQAVSGTGIGTGAVITGISSNPTAVWLSVDNTAAGATTTAVFADMAGSFAASPIIDVQAGAVLDVSAIPGGLSLGANQTLQGSGNITGAVTSDGRLAPGTNGTGTLTVSQDYTQTAAGTLRFAPQSATATPALVVSGTADLDGTLEVSLANGYVPAANDTLAILRADTALTGSFADIQLPGLPGGLEWDVLATADTISLKVVAVASALAVTPVSNDFGGVLTGATAQTTFVLTNTGATPLTGTAAVTGAPFAIVSGGAYSLDPGASADVVVEFAPTAIGVFTDGLVLASTGGNGTYPLGGSGVIPAVLGVSPPSRDLGGVLQGTTAQATFVVTNTGGLPLTGTATVGASFSVVNGASFSVEPGASANVVVRFHAPAAAGAFSDVVVFTSNAGNLSRMIAATSLAGLPEVPADNTVAYSFDALPGMPAVSASGMKYLAPLATLKQTFIPRSDAFLTAFSGQEGNGARPFALTSLSLKLNGYQNTDATFRVAVSRVEADGARTLFFSQDFQQRVYGSTVRTWTFSEPILLTCDAQYELAITLVQGGNDYSTGVATGVNLFVSASDYPDGALSTGGDLWFGLAGTTALPVFNSLALADHPSNTYYFDAGPNADSTNHDNLKGKLLGVNGDPEQLNFVCPPSWPPLTFAMADPSTATLQVQGGGNTYALTLNGAAEGETFLFAKAGGTVVGYLKLQSYPRRPVKLSYSYVQYPGESDHALKHASPEIMAYISSVYAKANVAIQWTDHGILTYEWDADGDGTSGTDDYSELWSPLLTGVIPNRNNVFSNVYMLRKNKDDNHQGGINGGGTSNGFGPATPPAVTAGYGAVVRCHLLRPAGQFASTLAHEVGHNLGLWHTGIGTSALDNLMDVGRAGDSLWSWQWDIVHATLKTVAPPVIDPDGNGNGILDSWENQMFGSSAAGANPPGDDPDGDGLDNLLEYALGTHPLQSNANPLAMTMPQVGEERYLRISVPKNPVATNLTFAAEVSENVASWSGSGVVVEENSTGRFTARDSVPVGSAPRRFIRLKVTVNP